MNFLAAIGRAVLNLLAQIGRVTRFTGQTLAAVVSAPFYGRLLAQQIMRIGYFSLPVVGLTALSTGAVLALQMKGEVVRQARFAFGGMAATVKRAAAAEAAVQGQAWSKATAQAAAAALAQDFKPLSDLRASEYYRLRVAQNLFTKCWLESDAGQPLSVWRLPT